MPYADNEGVSICYESYGSGIPVVFLHPWHQEPRGFIAELCAG